MTYTFHAGERVIVRPTCMAAIVVCELPGSGMAALDGVKADRVRVKIDGLRSTLIVLKRHLDPVS